MRVAAIIVLSIVIIFYGILRKFRYPDTDTPIILIEMVTILGAFATVIGVIEAENEPYSMFPLGIEITIPFSEVLTSTIEMFVPATETPISAFNTDYDKPIPTVTLSPAPTVPIPAGIQMVDTRITEKDGMIQVYVPMGHFFDRISTGRCGSRE